MASTMVTGGLGYVGRHLVARLAERGEKVISYNRDFAEGEDPNVVYVQGELYDLPRFVHTIERYEVKRILHTAAMSHPELSIDLPITTFTANVDGTVHVFEAARMTGVRHVVNFSSECAYGHVDGELVTEHAAPNPTTPYGVTKVATELLGRVYNDLYGLDVISLRITEIYGPGNKMPQFLREIIGAALRGERYRLEKGGDHRFQFIRVEDVARAAVLAADAQEPGQRVYNVTGGSQVTLAEAAQIVRDAVPGADLWLGPGYLPNLDRQGPYDISAAERDSVTGPSGRRSRRLSSGERASFSLWARPSSTATTCRWRRTQSWPQSWRWPWPNRSTSSSHPPSPTATGRVL